MKPKFGENSGKYFQLLGFRYKPQVLGINLANNNAIGGKYCHYAIVSMVK